jgi:hypothetical protein
LKQIIHIPLLLILSAILFMVACSTPRELTVTEDLERAEIESAELVAMIPDYRDELTTISGSGRALVSEPGGSDRVSLQFHSNRSESLMTVRNNVGIEGGQIYVDSDSLLIYNRLDRIAEKVPLHEGKLSSVGSIASINILDLINFTIDEADISEIYEDRSYYYAILHNRTQVKISKQNGAIQEVIHSADLYDAPYSKIEYEGYAEIEGFHLPRRITIFSRDEASRATLLVQRLEVNTELPELAIVLPDDIPIQRL